MVWRQQWRVRWQEQTFACRYNLKNCDKFSFHSCWCSVDCTLLLHPGRISVSVSCMPVRCGKLEHPQEINGVIIGTLEGDFWRRWWRSRRLSPPVVLWMHWTFTGHFFSTYKLWMNTEADPGYVVPSQEPHLWQHGRFYQTTGIDQAVFNVWLTARMCVCVWVFTHLFL